jgi:phosphatidylserine decarboxylase
MTRLPVADEGLKIAAGVEVGAVALALVSPLLAVPVALAGLGILAFFRDPERSPPNDFESVVSPADGRVVFAAREGNVLRVSVFMSVTNVHVNRAPIQGVITRTLYVPGKFVNATLDKASADNERMRYLIRRSDGEAIAVTQIAGLLARRIVPFVQRGSKIAKGERIGLIRFGSRADVHLPLSAELLVNVGDKVRAGESIVASLPKRITT